MFDAEDEFENYDYDIIKGQNVIGRDPSESHIYIQSAAISRVHAIIEGASDGCTIIDKNSSNGTYKNGTMKLKPNVLYGLEDGDTIKCGNSTFRFKAIEKKAEKFEDEKDHPANGHNFLIPETPCTSKKNPNHKWIMPSSQSSPLVTNKIVNESLDNSSSFLAPSQPMTSDKSKESLLLEMETQAIEGKNETQKPSTASLLEMETQEISNGIPKDSTASLLEMETQAVGDDIPKSSTASLLEMETQAIDNDVPKNSTASLLEMETQVLGASEQTTETKETKNILEMETQDLTVEKTREEKLTGSILEMETQDLISAPSNADDITYDHTKGSQKMEIDETLQQGKHNYETNIFDQPTQATDMAILDNDSNASEDLLADETQDESEMSGLKPDDCLMGKDEPIAESDAEDDVFEGATQIEEEDIFDDQANDENDVKLEEQEQQIEDRKEGSANEKKETEKSDKKDDSEKDHTEKLETTENEANEAKKEEVEEIDDGNESDASSIDLIASSQEEPLNTSRPLIRPPALTTIREESTINNTSISIPKRQASLVKKVDEELDLSDTNSGLLPPDRVTEPYAVFQKQEPGEKSDDHDLSQDSEGMLGSTQMLIGPTETSTVQSESESENEDCKDGPVDETKIENTPPQVSPKKLQPLPEEIEIPNADENEGDALPFDLDDSFPLDDDPMDKTVELKKDPSEDEVKDDADLDETYENPGLTACEILELKKEAPEEKADIPKIEDQKNVEETIDKSVKKTNESVIDVTKTEKPATTKDENADLNENAKENKESVAKTIKGEEESVQNSSNPVKSDSSPIALKGNATDSTSSITRKGRKSLRKGNLKESEKDINISKREEQTDSAIEEGKKSPDNDDISRKESGKKSSATPIKNKKSPSESGSPEKDCITPPNSSPIRKATSRNSSINDVNTKKESEDTITKSPILSSRRSSIRQKEAENVKNDEKPKSKASSPPGNQVPVKKEPLSDEVSGSSLLTADEDKSLESLIKRKPRQPRETKKKATEKSKIKVEDDKVEEEDEPITSTSSNYPYQRRSTRRQVPKRSYSPEDIRQGQTNPKGRTSGSPAESLSKRPKRSNASDISEQPQKSPKKKLKVEPKLEPTNIETGKVEPKAEPKGKVKAEPKGKPKVESKVAPDVELKSTNATQSTRSRRSAPVKSSAEPVKATTTRRTSRKTDTLADKKEAVVSLEQLSLPANIIAEAKHNSKKQKLSVVSENDENEDTNRNDARGKRSNAGRKRMISDKSEAPPSTEVEKTASTRSNRRRTTQTSVKGNNDDVPVPKVEAAGGRKRPKSEAVLKTDQKSMENSRKNKEDGKEDAEVGQLETKKGLKRPNSEVKIKSEGQSTSRLPMTSKIEETKPKTETARGRKRPKSEAMINTGIEAPATSATGRRNARSMAPEPKPSTSNATSSRGKRTSVSKGNKPSDDVEDTLEDTRKKFKPKVMLTGYESPQDVKIIKDLGGIVSTNIKDCTVLITTKLGRTAKLLCALGRGIPIVSPNWLVQCKMTKTFLGNFLKLFV